MKLYRVIRDAIRQAVKQVIYQLNTTSLEHQGKFNTNSKLKCEKDVLRLLKKWNILGNTKGIQKIKIACSVDDMPKVELEVTKYWDDKKTKKRGKK